MSEEKKHEEEAKDEIQPLEDTEAEKVVGGIGTNEDQASEDTSEGSGSGWWSNPNR